MSSFDLDVMRLRRTMVSMLQRMDTLENRVQACEEKLQLHSGVKDPSLARNHLTSDALPPPLPITNISVTAASAGEDQLLSQQQSEGSERLHIVGVAYPATHENNHNITQLSSATSSKESETAQSRSLELMIGGRWYALAGAVFIIIGLGLFLKFGIENGWFSMAPWARCILVACAGVGMLFGGEVVRRRISRLAAAGLYAAGLATIYLTVYGAYTLYDLLPINITFALMAATAILGIGLACFTRLPSVAIFSLVGGYVVPILCASSQASDIALPAYLLMLLVIAMVSTAIMGQSFAPVRTVGRIGVMLLGALGAMSYIVDAPITYVIFGLAAWVIVHGELMLSAMRGQLEPREIEVVAGEHPIFTQLRQVNKYVLYSGPIAAMFAVGAWSVGLSLLGLRVEHWNDGLPSFMSASAWKFIFSSQAVHPAEPLVPAGLMFAALCAGWLLVPMMRLVNITPTTQRERLAAAFYTQAGCLLLVLIAVALGGPWQLLSWTFAGVAAFIAGKWVGSKTFFAYGAVALLLSTLRLVWPSAIYGQFSNTLLEVGDVVLTQRGLLCLIVAASWAVGALLLDKLRSNTEVDNEDTESFTISAPRSLMIFAAAIVAGNAWIIGEYTIPQIGMSLSISGLLLAASSLWRSDTRVASGGVLCAGMFALFISRWWESDEFIRIGNVTIGNHGMGMLVANVAWTLLTIAKPSSTFAPNKLVYSSICSVFAALTLMAVTFHDNTSLVSAMNIWLLWGTTGVILSYYAARGVIRLRGLCELLPGVFVVSVASLALWFVRDVNVLRDWSFAPFMRGVMLTVIAWVLGRTCGLLMPAERAWYIAAGQIAAGALLLITTSCQVAVWAKEFARDNTVRQAAISMWWGVYALGLIALGFLRRSDALRYAGLGLLAVAATKGFVVDIATSPLGWRIVSFILLGLMMIAVGIAYQKFLAPVVRQSSKENAPPASENLQ